MLVMGIETTCDETGCALVRDGYDILSNVVTSQIDLHAEYGGVVPELACRRHVDVLIPVIDEAIKKAQIAFEDVDLIAVANGPGLIGALLIGLNAAKSFALALDKPLIGINHIEAHLYAATMSHQKKISYPCLGVVISGGHTALVHVKDVGAYTLIGQTVDDAIGEAFDKVAKILGLPYPGGPSIEALAKKGDPSRYPFKSGTVKKRPLDFSFSGLKTAVLYATKGQGAHPSAPLAIDESEKTHLAAAFQEAALGNIVKKALLAAEQHQYQAILFGGGVTNNRRLREMFAEKAPDIYCFWPSEGLTLDNAAMIAGLGYHAFKTRGEGDDLTLQAMTQMTFAEDIK